MKTQLMLAVTASICLLVQPVFAETTEQNSKTDMFAKIDTNGDGKISKEEWLAHSTKQFKEMCDDGDNAITRSEWDEFQAKNKPSK